MFEIDILGLKLREINEFLSKKLMRKSMDTKTQTHKEDYLVNMPSLCAFEPLCLILNNICPFDV